MGRWRDGVVMLRNDNDSIKPNQLEELVVDQHSELVGKDRKGSYCVTECEHNRPIFVSYDITPGYLRNFERVEFPWREGFGFRNLKTDEMSIELSAMSRGIYKKFKEAVAESFSCFRYELDFYHFIRGQEIVKEDSGIIHLDVAISPVYVTDVDHSYTPAGAKLPFKKL